MSTVTLTMAAAMFTQYWSQSFSIAWAVFLFLLAILLMNACGVQVREGASPRDSERVTNAYRKLYGNMEWVFKWLKILLLVALCILMIAIKAGGKCSDLLCRDLALMTDYDSWKWSS